MSYAAIYEAFPWHLWACVFVCPIRVRRKVAKTMTLARHSLPVKIRSTRFAQGGEHERSPPPYTEIFPDCAELCVADLAVTQIESVYV